MWHTSKRGTEARAWCRGVGAALPTLGGGGGSWLELGALGLAREQGALAGPGGLR